MQRLSEGDVQWQAEFLQKLFFGSGSTEPLSREQFEGSIERAFRVLCARDSIGAQETTSMAGSRAMLQEEQGLVAMRELVGEMFRCGDTIGWEELLERCKRNKKSLTEAVHHDTIGSWDERELRLKMMNDELYEAQQELLQCPRSMRSALRERINNLDKSCRALHDFHRKL